jgi:hypothetical protein
MSGIDLGKLVDDSITAANAAIGDDLTKLEGFARSQFEAIAQSAADITADRLAGKLSEQEFEILINRIPNLVKNTVNTLRGLALVTLEKAWNAIASTVQGAIRGAVAGLL